MSTRVLPGRQIIDARKHELRHVYPSSAGTTTVLGRLFAGEYLPPQWTQGTITRRRDDSGEFTVTFPNSAGADGKPYRTRFDPDGHKEFIEVYDGGPDPAFVGVILNMKVNRREVTLSGPDAGFLLRKGIELDRTWTAAHRDVCEAYTRVPLPIVADDFTGAVLNATTWPTLSASDTATVANGLLTLTDVSGDAVVTLRSKALTFTDERWSASCVLRACTGLAFQFQVTDSGGALLYYVGNSTGPVGWFVSTATDSVVVPEEAPLLKLPATLTVERVGRWIRGYVNGRLIGYLPASTTAASMLRFSVAGGAGAAASVESVLMRSHEPLLARGTDKGSYVLPSAAYPPVGLRGRYYSDTDFETLTAAGRAARILTPNRTVAAERVEAITAAAGLTAPANVAGNYLSVRWSGAVYLPLSLGDFGIRFTSLVGGARCWVGKTALTSEAVLNDWTVAASRTVTGTVTASALGAADGWYPIVVEFHDDAQAQAIALQFSPPGAGTYTDPGGGTITRGSYANIPATSLTPLGIFDGRIQGSTHFDIVQSTAADAGYQWTVEPKQLESGEFPGRLVPRVRVGRDTAVELTSEDLDGDQLIDPSYEVDASDLTTTVLGRGAGIADGAGSQVNVEVSDLTAVSAALFDLQTQVDAGDISFRDLLASRMSTELYLRETPWTNVAGTPRAIDHLADGWPLTGQLAAMRWTPGDAVRVSMPDIGVQDLTPRVLLQVTRTFVPEGRTGTSVDFRQRPLGVARSIRQALLSSLAGQRVFQRQWIELAAAVQADTSIAAAGFGGFQIITLLPGDRIVKAVWRIVGNSTPNAMGLEINSTDRTTALGGSWSNVPTEVDITAYATTASSSDARIFVRAVNKAGITSGTFISQLIVRILR